MDSSTGDLEGEIKRLIKNFPSLEKSEILLKILLETIIRLHINFHQKKLMEKKLMNLLEKNTS